jgi:hypothetical protein
VLGLVTYLLILVEINAYFTNIATDQRYYSNIINIIEQLVTSLPVSDNSSNVLFCEC